MCLDSSPRTPLSSLPPSGSRAVKPSGSGVSKNLFSVPASEAADPSAGAAALSAPTAGGSGGSGGFPFAAPPSASSLLAAHVSGKPLFGSANNTEQGGWIEVYHVGACSGCMWLKDNAG